MINLPYIDYGYMTEKSVQAVIDEVRPYERVNFDKLTDDEINEYMEAWLSGVDGYFFKEFQTDVITSDPFFIDTFLSLYTDPIAYQHEMLARARELFFRPMGRTSLNDMGLSLAKQLEANIHAYLESAGMIEDAA